MQLQNRLARVLFVQTVLCAGISVLISSSVFASSRYRLVTGKTYDYSISFTSEHGNSKLKTLCLIQVRCNQHLASEDSERFELSVSVKELSITEVAGPYASTYTQQGVDQLVPFSFAVCIDQHGNLVETDLSKNLPFLSEGDVEARRSSSIILTVLGRFWRCILPALVSKSGEARTVLLLQQPDWESFGISALRYSELVQGFHELEMNSAPEDYVETLQPPLNSAHMLWCKVTKELFSTRYGDPIDCTFEQRVSLFFKDGVVLKGEEQMSYKYDKSTSTISFSAVLISPRE